MDSRTGVDIHAAVLSVLAPLLRANALTWSHGDKSSRDSGSGPSLDSIVLSDNGIQCSEETLSTSDMELEEVHNSIPDIQLALADGKVISRSTVDVDYTVPVSRLKVVMNWSDREHEIYDFSFLEDLPEVFKSGFMSKKTRQEAITLYSCLEAFIKEEPLGPDDMWLVLFLH